MRSYPTKIKVKGKNYSLNTDYKVALRCIQISDDPDISDLERSEAIVYLLTGLTPSLLELGDYLSPIKIYLEGGLKNGDSLSASIPDMDVGQDYVYILASFRSDYGIDLTKEEMHWWLFLDLMNGLTPDCILSRIRQIRNDDPNDYSGKYKEDLINAQRNFAIKPKVSKEQQEAEEEFLAWLGGADNVRR